MHHHSTTHVPRPYLFWLPCVSHSIAHGVARASRCRFSLFLLHAKVTSYWELTRALLVLSAIAIRRLCKNTRQLMSAGNLIV